MPISELARASDDHAPRSGKTGVKGDGMHQPGEASSEFEEPTPAELRELVHLKQHGGDPRLYGWATRMRLGFDYFTPDEVYEASVGRLIRPGCTWLDVGCGRNLFPNNPGLSRTLADRCALLVGLDPDQTIEENCFVHERVRSAIEDFFLAPTPWCAPLGSLERLDKANAVAIAPIARTKAWALGIFVAIGLSTWSR